MKTLLTTVAATILAATSLPAAPEVPAAPPPAAAKADEAAKDVWLGLLTRRLPRLVAEDLGLPAGSGIIVEKVIDNSPAAEAGVLKDDVLIKLADQKLLLPDQLPLLLKAYKPGDVVAIEVLRDRQPHKLDVKLALRPEGYARTAPGAPETDEEEPNLADGAIPDIMQGLGGPGGLEDVEKHLEKIRRQMERMQRMPLPQGNAKGQFNMQVFRLDQGRVQINDGDGSISIEKKDGKTTLTAKDKDGKVMYEGPYSSDEDKARVPEEIRKRADRFKFEDGGLHLGGIPGIPGGGDPPGVDGEVKPGERPD